jgi:hypothetical protein
MDLSPSREQAITLALDLAHEPAQLGPTDADGPIERQPFGSFQDDPRFPARPEDVHVGRAVIVREDDEAVPEGPVNRHHVL